MPMDEKDKKAVALFVNIVREESDKIPDGYMAVKWFFRTAANIIVRFIEEAQGL